MGWVCSSPRTGALLASQPLCGEFGYKAPGLRLYLESRGRLYFFPYLVVQPSRGVVCDPFGTGRSPSDISQGLDRASFFHPVRPGRCRRTDTSEIVASDESGRVKNGPANHDSDSRHCI